MKKILDVCCGSRMFWFDRENPNVDYNDIRNESHILCDGRELHITPDYQYDFRDLKFSSEKYSLVIFDPPHFNRLGKNSWMAKKYGVLEETWRDDIKKGFNECMRVLKTDGVLIFKWSELQISTTEIIEVIGQKPLIGHISGKRSNTHWMVFMKGIK